MPIQAKVNTFYVADVERSRHFYRTLLGIAPAVESEVRSEFTPDGIVLAVQQADLPASTRSVKPAIPGHPAGSNSLRLAVPDLEAACLRLQQAGFAVERSAEKEGTQPQAYLHDPDGFSIELEQIVAPETPQKPTVGPKDAVSLREINAETLGAIIRLSDTLSPAQKHMVATNAVSVAQAHFSPYAWFRAIYAGDTPVGFAMVYIGPEDDADPKSKTVYFLWRFMIGGLYQGMGFGRRALELIIEEVKRRGARRLGVSCGEGEGSPEGFYRSLGFKRDGHMYGDEVGLVLSWE